LADAFALELGRWRTAGLDTLRRRWLAAAHPLGTPLVTGQPPVSGTFAGLDGSGALQLRLADGTTRLIQAGEVNFA